MDTAVTVAQISVAVAQFSVAAASSVPPHSQLGGLNIKNYQCCQ